ncbi:MAG: hypothetical protein K2H41_01105 [Acetatifactor sp.]|nr:hypothetical protein [Acetatifactor sp.]MDE7112819.1 hypothetical protein [Acetatifactor sp.]
MDNNVMDYNAMDSSTSQLMKELRFTRIICIISSVLTFCLLVGGVFLFGKVQKLAEICEPAIEKISDVDVESLNETLDNVNASLESVDWEQVADVLGELDVDALNSAVEGLDTEELTEALQNLNDTVDKIKEVSEKMSSFGSMFGGIFNQGQ